MFRVLVICVFLLTVATDVVQCTLQLPAGFTLHQVTATWEEASEQCKSEGGILASPVNETVLNMMKSVMAAKILTYHIGTRARDTPGKYVSIEGIPLENMTAAMSDMVQQLDRSHGDCLSMDHDRIQVIPCGTELPYICYGTLGYQPPSATNTTSCGPIEQGYEYERATDSCYKLYTYPNKKQWHSALMTCVAEGAHLAVIETAEEANILSNMIARISDVYIYIGLRDVTGRGDWISVHWQPVEQLYNDWGSASGRSKPANLEFTYGALRYRELSAVSNIYDASFVCEKRRNV